MAWFALILAGILVVFWSTMMKWSEDSSKIDYSVYTVIGMIASFYPEPSTIYQCVWLTLFGWRSVLLAPLSPVFSSSMTN